MARRAHPKAAPNAAHVAAVNQVIIDDAKLASYAHLGACEVDLSADKRHRMFEHGDLTVYIAWDGREGRPCMALTRGRMMLGTEAARVYLIPDLNLWAWSEEIGDVRHVAATSIMIAEHLGFEVTKPMVNRIRSLVISHIDDLLTCPPKPMFNTFVAAETRVTDRQTGKVTEGEIREDV